MVSRITNPETRGSSGLASVGVIAFERRPDNVPGQKKRC